MKEIDEYIKETANMKNASNGGSPAYDFGDVVLVKYSIPTKYGIARENEELIAIAANKKNEEGVRTPRHLAIKREINGQDNFCWVLQEKAKGKNFEEYYSARNNPQEQLRCQKELLNAPDYHYEKCIEDLASLFNMGLELKPKNIFYDSQPNGGFTFIDLLGSDITPYNPESISSVLRLLRSSDFISNFTCISEYDQEATPYEKEESEKLYLGIKKRIFCTMEKVVPNFNQFKRWILRTYSKEQLAYFESNGIFVGDLSLTDEEYETFDNYLAQIVNKSIKQIESGEKPLWDIKTNQIRTMLESMGMYSAWNYHRASAEIDRKDFDDDYDFEYAKKRKLDELVDLILKNRLYELKDKSDNPYILKAAQELLDEDTKKNSIKK